MGGPELLHVDGYVTEPAVDRNQTRRQVTLPVARGGLPQCLGPVIFESRCFGPGSARVADVTVTVVVVVMDAVQEQHRPRQLVDVGGADNLAGVRGVLAR